MPKSKYPVLTEALSRCMVKINTNMEEAIDIMKTLKESDDILLLNPCVMVRFADNINRIKELAK